MNIYETDDIVANVPGQCVEQPRNKLLPYHSYGNSSNTPDMCIASCAEDRYKFAGVKWSKECWCGDTEPPQSSYTAAAQCNMPCSGDETLMCGGGSVLNLYKTNVSGDDLFIQEMKSLLNDEKVPQSRNPMVVKHMKKYFNNPSRIMKLPIFNEVLVPAFIKMVENQELLDLYPDFGSYFQKNFLPYLIQDAPADSPLLKVTLPTEFPPPVDAAAMTTNKKVTIVNPSISDNHNYTAMAWRGRTQWISTGLYAKQGELVTVTVPTNVRGKFRIRVGAHNCNLQSFNLKRWMKNEAKWQKYRPAWVYQYYDKSLIQEKIKLLTPYGGLIYVVIDLYNTIGNFDLEFENVIESPRFIYGVSTNEQWGRDYQLSPAPIVELEVPGITFTIPKLTLDSIDTDMELLANTWKRIMDAVFDLQGFVPDLSIRYVTDVENDYGSAHSGYPIQHSHLPSAFFDTTRMNASLIIPLHEIGHNLQDPRYTMGPDFGEVTNGFFINYVYDELFGGHPEGNWTHIYTVIFRNTPELAGKWLPYEHACMLIKDEFGWEPFKEFFRYYLYKIPAQLSPNTQENSLSLMVKVLSKAYNRNLVPYFQWWSWPVLNDTIEETKDLPEWEGAIQKLETTDAKCTFPMVNVLGWKPCCQAKGSLCGEGEKKCASDSQCEEGLVCKWSTCSKK